MTSAVHFRPFPVDRFYPFSFGPISLVISHSAVFLSIATPVEKGFIGFYGELVIQKAPAMASAFSLFNSIV